MVRDNRIELWGASKRDAEKGLKTLSSLDKFKHHIVNEKVIMNLATIVVNVGILVTVIAVVIVIYVTAKYRKGELNEEPGHLQFAEFKNIPGEDYVDLNVVKMGKTKTLKSYSSRGYISWEAYFNPKTREDMAKREPATIAVITLLGVGIIITAIMKLMDITIGYYFGLAFLFLASLLVLVKFIEYKIIKRPNNKRGVQ